MSYQIRIANEDIELCKVDKRKRYGIESIGKIPAGTTFKYRDGIEEKYIAASVEFGKFHTWVPRAKIEDIMAKSMVKPASTAKDVFMLNDCHMTCADDVLEHMVKAGFITVGQLDLAIKSWEVSLNAEQGIYPALPESFKDA